MNILRNKRDRENGELISLWVKSFGDTQQTAEGFFSCDDIITLTEYVDNRLASMASLVPIKREESRGFYIYGVCVEKSFRGKGLFRKIVNDAERLAREDGADFVCLIPADEKLMQTYVKWGYDTKVSPYECGKCGNIFICSEDFRDFAKPEYECSVSSGMCGLLKSFCSADDAPLIFGEPMGDI